MGGFRLKLDYLCLDITAGSNREEETMKNRLYSPAVKKSALWLSILIAFVLSASGAISWTAKAGTLDLVPGYSVLSRPTDVPYTEYVPKQADILGGATGAAIATCPDDSIVVGGGYSADHDVTFYTQYKYDNGWRGDARNNSTIDKKISVYAVCLHNVPGASVTQTHGQVDVSPGNDALAVAYCPAGSIGTGGGFHAYDDGRLRVYNSTIADGSEGWQSWAHNTDDSTYTYHVYAICLTGSAGSMARVFKSAVAPPTETASAGPKCSLNSILTSGGFAAQDELLIYVNSGPYSDDEWQVDVKNTHLSKNRTIFGYAYCLSLPGLPFYDEFYYLPLLANAALP